MSVWNTLLKPDVLGLIFVGLLVTIVMLFGMVVYLKKINVLLRKELKENRGIISYYKEKVAHHNHLDHLSRNGVYTTPVKLSSIFVDKHYIM